MMTLVANAVGAVFRALTRLITGAMARWENCEPGPGPRVYFANHNSHIDFVLLWTLIPSEYRPGVRPVAAADYWGRGAIRRFIIHRVFRGLLIERSREKRTENPIDTMAAALDAGDALIIFPEGTRNLTDELLPFKSGIYHLAAARPDVEFVPVWIDNLSRVMPKGEFLPVPLLCGVNFGAPITIQPGESKEDFLGRAREALLALRSQ